MDRGGGAAACYMVFLRQVGQWEQLQKEEFDLFCLVPFWKKKFLFRKSGLHLGY